MKCRFAVAAVLLAAAGAMAPSLAADFTPDAMDGAAIQRAIDVAGVQGLDMKSFSVTSGVGAK